MSESKSLVAVVPEVYYDLIARVAPGVVFLGTLASDATFVQPPITPRDLNGSLVVAFFLLGYTAGILLSGLGNWIASWLWRRMWRRVAAREPAMDEQLQRHGGVAPLYDHLCRDERNRAVLIKLTAEVVLCANLLVAFLVLLVARLIVSPVIDTRAIVIVAGAVFSALALFTRQYNATQRQCNLTRAEVVATT